MRKKRSRNGAGKRLIAALAYAGLVVLGACGQEAGGVALEYVPGGDATQGQQAIQRYGCGTCHVIPGIAGANGTVGPPLEAYARRKYIAGTLTNTPDHLIAWIQNPQTIEPGTAMPNMGIGERDARDIAAYLATLR